MREAPQAAAPPQPSPQPAPAPALADEEPSAADALAPATVPRPPPGRAPLIAVDAMGGDHAPEQIVAGAIIAAREHQVRVVLTGRPGLLRPLLARQGAADLVGVVAAEEAVGMDEGALASWRRPRSSIAIACQLVHRGQAAAVMSAGSTGAIVATARLRLRPLPGVGRPALAVVLPTRPAPTLLLDAGRSPIPSPSCWCSSPSSAWPTPRLPGAWPSRGSGC